MQKQLWTQFSWQITHSRTKIGKDDKTLEMITDVMYPNTSFIII